MIHLSGELVFYLETVRDLIKQILQLDENDNIIFINGEILNTEFQNQQNNQVNIFLDYASSSQLGSVPERTKEKITNDNDNLKIVSKTLDFERITISCVSFLVVDPTGKRYKDNRIAKITAETIRKKLLEETPKDFFVLRNIGELRDLSFVENYLGSPCKRYDFDIEISHLNKLTSIKPKVKTVKIKQDFII